MRAYIEILWSVGIRRHELSIWELLLIGRFSRKNVAKWLNKHTGVGWGEYLPAEDFHAVRGNIDIPWATEQGKAVFETATRLSALKAAKK